MFKHPTYIVLELPDHIAKKILTIRNKNKDKFRSALPAEITVAGSSGIGIISEHQSYDEVFESVREIARQTDPFELRFDHVTRFESTDIFAMKLEDESEVRKLHQSFIDSDISFDTCDFDFEPHCTLRSRSPITEDEVTRLYKETINESFRVDTISVYMLDKLPIKKLFSCKLGSDDT